jgi:hypothetical protein
MLLMVEDKTQERSCETYFGSIGKKDLLYFWLESSMRTLKQVHTQMTQVFARFARNHLQNKNQTQA